MSKIILVPIDFTDATELVVEEAANLARAMGAEICLFHVRPYQGEFDGFLVSPPYVSFLGGTVPVSVYPPKVEGGEPQTDTEASFETRQLQQWQEKLHRAEIQADALLAYGSVTHDIVSEAKKQEACMIVMGSHGGGALRHMIAGSVCRGVLKHAPCPVVVVPIGAKVEDTCKIAG